MGGDWHDLGGALGEDAETRRCAAAARSDRPARRARPGRRTGWRRILAREGVTVDARGARSISGSALGTLASAPVEERTLTGLSVLLQSQRAEARARALLPRRRLRAPARRRERAARRGRRAGLRDRGADRHRRAAPAVLAYLFHRIEDRLDGRPTLIIVDEGWLALDDPAVRRPAPRMAEDAAQEERSRGLRDPVARRHRRLARSRRRSSRAARPASSCRTSARSSRRSPRSIGASGSTTARSRSSPAPRPSATIICQSRRGNRLFELGLGEVGARLHRRVVEGRPAADHPASRRARPRRLCRRLAAAARPRLGRRPARDGRLPRHPRKRRPCR